MSALIDPSSFAPPPKNVNYHSAAAEERQVANISQKGPLTPAEYQAREQEKANRIKEEEMRDREERRLDREAKQSLRAAQEGREPPGAPRLPSRIDTSGLSTSQFAPPVARSTAADGTIVIRPTAASTAKVNLPLLPSRLPSRQNSSPEREVASFAPGLQGQGQSPMEQERPPVPARINTGSSSHSHAAPDNPQVGELQSRFARMKASSPTTEAQNRGSTWQGQGAARTTPSSRDDPTTTSASLSSASSPSSVHKSHGEQSPRVWKSVETSSWKYGQSNNVAPNSGPTQKNFQEEEEVESPIDMRDNTRSPLKKAPPPKPKKKAELSGY